MSNRNNKQQSSNNRNKGGGGLLIAIGAAVTVGALVGTAISAALKAGRSRDDEEQERRRTAFSASAGHRQINLGHPYSAPVPASNKWQNIDSSPSLTSDIRAHGSSSSGGGFTCAICRDQMSQEISSLACGHVFCTGCLEMSLERNNTCPSCRRGVLRGEVRRLYT